MPANWIKLRDCKATEVSTQKCKNVDKLIVACKKHLLFLYGDFPVGDIYLSTTCDGPALRPGLKLSKVKSQPGYSENSDLNPLYINVVDRDAPSRSRNFRGLPFKKLSVDAYCGKFLGAIARKLYLSYAFDIFQSGGMWIDDVLAAKDGLEGFDWQLREFDEPTTMPAERLPDRFTEEEWATIRHLRLKTTEEFYNGYVPQLPDGTPYLVIPHSEYTKEMITTIKNIALKGNMFGFPTEYEVLDEDDPPFHWPVWLRSSGARENCL